MDINFRVKEVTHTVKLTAYTTTCQLMIQPKGEQSGVKTHLGSRGTPRFFVETFLIPWCEKSVESKLYNEIKRMESRKGAKNSGEITEPSVYQRDAVSRG